MYLKFLMIFTGFMVISVRSFSKCDSRTGADAVLSCAYRCTVAARRFPHRRAASFSCDSEDEEQPLGGHERYDSTIVFRTGHFVKKYYSMCRCRLLPGSVARSSRITRAGTKKDRNTLQSLLKIVY